MNKKNWERSVRPIKLLLFFGVLAVLCLIGLVLPRPTVSELEKRELTEFPAVTWQSFWDGSFFSAVDTWYADTYPLREPLIAGNHLLQGLYGIQTDVIVGVE